MLPASPVTTAVAGALGTAGGVLDEAADAARAVDRAISEPTTDSIGAALEATRNALTRAGEGTTLADKLGDALGALQQATEAAAQVRAAIDDPSAASIGQAVGAAGQVLGATAGGGFAATLAPALGAIGTAMKALGPLLGGAGPVGLVSALVLGAWQAWKVGGDHYRRWMARVLDRPVTPDLFPASAWDGAAARALIGAVPALARVCRKTLEEGSQEECVNLMTLLFQPDAVTRLQAEYRDEPFASLLEAETAVNQLRRLVLDRQLDRDGPEPVPAGNGLLIPQADLRATLDKLREAGAGAPIETLGLLTSTLIRGRDDGKGNALAVDLPKLLADALPVAGTRAEAVAADPPPPPPPVEGEPRP
jgi:hypothetical protein